MDKPQTERRRESNYLVEYVAAVGAALLALVWVTSTDSLDLSWAEVARYAQTAWEGIFRPG